MRLYTLIPVMLVGAVLMSAPAEGGVRATARFGGTIFTNEASLIDPVLTRTIDGAYVVGGEVEGPAVLLGLRPTIAYLRHWSGGDEGSEFTFTSNMIAFGLAYGVRVGYATAAIRVAAMHYSDTYTIPVGPPPRDDIKDGTWGVAPAFDLRFGFLERVDVVLGYQLLTRSLLKVNEQPPGFPMPIYELIGRSVEHSFTAGVSVCFGGP